MLFLSAPATADDSFSADRCIERLVRADCPVPSEAQAYLRKQLTMCLHIEDTHSKQSLEVLVLKPRRAVTIVQTAGAYHWKGYCHVNRFSLGAHYLQEARVVSQKKGMSTALLVSDSGQLYALHPDRRFFELMDGDGKPFHEIKTLMPEHDGQAVKIVYHSAQPKTLATSDLVEKSAKRPLVAPDPFWSLAGLED